eukprot:8483245-Karenia_brevis.AAC.1
MTRIKGARARDHRVGQLNRVNKRAQALYNTGVWPAATYGAEGLGYAPTMISRIMTMGANAVASAKQ